MLTSFNAMLRDDDGATLVEYSLVVALIAGVAIAILSQLGGSITTLFTNVDNKVSGANSKITPP